MTTEEVRTAVRDELASYPSRVADPARAAVVRSVPAGEWSPTDVLRHLIAVEEQVWHERLDQLAREDDPHWPWTEPDRWQGAPGASLDELLAMHAKRRAETVARLAALDDAGWSRTGTHATYGRLDVAGLMEKAIDHDREHLQVFEAPTHRTI
jgi:hypothetical protein